MVPSTALDSLSGIRAVHDDYAERARRATLQSLPAGEPRRWLYNLLPRYLCQKSAKYLRPVLCLASCAAHGGAADDALPAAVGLELLHAAFLIHDDIEDHSPLRRGERSLPDEYGMELALNAGDALAAHAQHFVAERVARFGARVTRAIDDEFHRAVRETVEGQAMELGWRFDLADGMGADTYVKMIAKKTAWYSTIAPLRIGALIATRGRADLDRMTPFGSLLGALYQVKNDLASLDPAFGDDGHRDLEDIIERKASLPLIYLLEPASHLKPEERQRLLAFYHAPARSARPPGVSAGHADREARNAKWVLALMQRYHCLELAAEDFWDLADAADACAASAFVHLPDTAARRLLERMPQLVLDGVTAPRPTAAGPRDR